MSWNSLMTHLSVCCEFRFFLLCGSICSVSLHSFTQRWWATGWRTLPTMLQKLKTVAAQQATPSSGFSSWNIIFHLKDDSKYRNVMIRCLATPHWKYFIYSNTSIFTFLKVVMNRNLFPLNEQKLSNWVGQHCWVWGYMSKCCRSSFNLQLTGTNIAGLKEKEQSSPSQNSFLHAVLF